MFSIIIPIYNESQNINKLIDEIDNSLSKYDNYEIIIINDASTDNTSDVLKQIKNNKILIISNPVNKGQSYSIFKGINKSSYDTIVTIDGDGQNNPADIPKLLSLYNVNKNIELVGGLRLKRQDNVIKIISSKIANSIRSSILKDSCIDTGCSLKVFNKKIFLQFPYFDSIHRFLPAMFSGFKYNTMFVPVDHRRRKFGNSKYGTMNRLFKGINDIIKVKRILKNIK